MKKFFILWSSQGASIIGSSVVGFALAWYLKQETGSATILSTAMIMNVLPSVAFGPFLGPLIDRWNRKFIIIGADLFTMLLTVVLVVLFFTNVVQIWHVYVIMFFRAFGNAFQQPAVRASVPMIVPEKHLVRANGLATTLDGAIIILPPVAGAFLMKVLPMHWVLSVDIVTALVAVACLLPLHIPQPQRETLTQKLNVIGDVMKGLRYVASRKTLLYMFMLFSVLNFLTVPLISLLPLWVERYFGNDILKLGWLQMTFGIGVLCGGLILSVWSGFKRRMATSFLGFMISMIPFIMFGFITERYFYLGLGLWFLSALGNAMSNAPIGAILQSTIPRDMQGRVFTVLGSICGGAIPLGLLVIGPIADAVELRTVFIASSILTLVLVLVFFKLGDFLNLEKDTPYQEIDDLTNKSS